MGAVEVRQTEIQINKMIILLVDGIVLYFL
jgi:hypothetical protein